MLFTDPLFLLRFLPVLLGVYFLAVAGVGAGPHGTRNAAAANWVLLGGGIVFYAVGAGAFIWILAGAVVFNLVVASGIQRGQEAGSAGGGLVPEALLTVAVAGNLILLGAFKFAHPPTDALGVSLTRLGGQPVSVPQLLVPFGLTFFVCHATSYVVDIYRGDVRPKHSITQSALYLLFFPFAVAGPVIRYRDVSAQLAKREVGMAAFSYGVRRFCVGWGKVFLIADTLATPADAIFGTPVTGLSTLGAWVGASCFTLRVYFDFSGYADMALGLGRILGFRLPENFRWPYAADSLHDFWRRWNLSLTSWLRSYTGLRLEDESDRPAEVGRNLAVLFVLVGLWHGPGWSVLRWGLFHAVVVGLERFGLAPRLRRWPRPLRHLYVLVLVMIGWVVFRSESLSGTWSRLLTMVGFRGAPVDLATLPLDWFAWSALLVGAVGSAPPLPWLSRWVVTVDAMATSGLMLGATAVIFVWRTGIRALEALRSRG